jgi:hypothetical protein
MQTFQKTQKNLMNHSSKKNFYGVFASIGGVTGVWAVRLIEASYSGEFIIFLLIKDPAIRIRSIFMNVV